MQGKNLSIQRSCILQITKGGTWKNTGGLSIRRNWVNGMRAHIEVAPGVIIRAKRPIVRDVKFGQNLKKLIKKPIVFVRVSAMAI